jgi:hypothetical protein
MKNHGLSIRMTLAIVLSLLGLWTIVLPTGPFPLNDDWQYAHVAKQLAETGIFRVDVPVAPTLVLQSAAGAAVTQVLGFSHVHLRALTVVVAAFLLVLLDSLLAMAGARLRYRLVAVAILVVNPLFLHLAFSFMTEFYGLAVAFFGVWLWFRAQQAETEGRSRMAQWGRLLAGAVMGSAFWVRQFSALVFPAAILSRHLVVHGWEGLRATAARVFRDSWAEALAFVIPVLCYFPWSRMTGNFNPAFSTPLSKVILRPAFGFWLTQTPVFLIYMTAFLMPLLIPVAALSWKSTFMDSSRARRPALCLVGVLGLTAILAALFGSRPFSNVQTLRPVFPFLGNVMLPFGLGPLTLTDTYMEAPKNIPGYSLGFWIILEVSLVALSWTWVDLSRRASMMFRARLVSSIRQQLILFGFLFAGLSFFLAVQAYLSGLFERYFFSSLLGVVLGTILLLEQIEPVKHLRRVVLGFAVLAWGLLGGLSIIAEHDYFRWNEVRWKLFERAVGQGISARQIDGGYELNGWLAVEGDRPNASDPDCNPRVSWFCGSRTFAIGLNPPEAGEILLREPVATWLRNFPEMMLYRRH